MGVNENGDEPWDWFEILFPLKYSDRIGQDACSHALSAERYESIRSV
jgi:hypothetical protein